MPEEQQPTVINIRELDIHSIKPRTDEPEETGSKLVVIGKPGSGKSVLIKYLCFMKRHLFPAACVISGTEDSTQFYAEIFADVAIHNELTEDTVKNFHKRQKVAKEYLQQPWALLLMDDCMEDSSFFRKPTFSAHYKNGRHWKLLSILGLQYAMDIPPAIRMCIDGTFIFREPNLRMRKILYENFASIIPTFKMFCAIMDEITSDHTALYIDNRSQSNNFEDCVFWIRADKVPNYKFGSDDYWDFHEARYDTENVAEAY